MAKGFAHLVDKAVDNEKKSVSVVPTATTNKHETSKHSPKKGKTVTAVATTITTTGSSAAAAAAASAASSSPTSTEVAKTQRKEIAKANWDKVTAGVNIAGVVAKNQRAAMGQKLFTRTLVSATTWEFFSPPPSNSFSGKIVPRALNRYKNRRLLSVEVHRVTPQSHHDEKVLQTHSRSYEECVVRYVQCCCK
jgi:hypothetical protein